MDCNYIEYYRHSDGLYYVIRYRGDGTPSTTPWGWRSEQSAINYIMAHGLEPIKRYPFGN